MGKYHSFLALFTVVLFAFHSSSESTEVSFGAGQPINVSYDGRGIMINGERKLIISGSIHYPRSTEEMWPSLIQLAKEGGLNAIETYVFWNAHEPVRREYDFTGNLDLVKFIKTIQSEGLYAILRIGPYVCAEWNYGGFPVWLHNLNNDITLRTTDQLFMDEMKTFTTKIVDMMKLEKLFASDGGPIILAQIENEFGNVESQYGKGGPAYITECGSFAESLNIGVPWIMCQQSDAPDPIINTCNGYYCDQFTPRTDNYPKMWTENWTGWYKNWGGLDPHRTAEDIAFAVARFYQQRGSLQNYYMYHGGTNFGRTSGGPFFTTSYDYDAPLNEYGLINQPKWGHLQQLHEVLLSLEKILTYGDFHDNDLGSWMYTATVFSYNGTRVCFFGNANDHENVTIDFEGSKILVPAWSVSIYRDCNTEIFNTATVSFDSSVLEKVIYEEGLTWTWRAEQLGAGRKPSTFAKQLLDQKSVTNDTSDYLWYITGVHLDETSPIWGPMVTLQINTTGHVLHVIFNEEYIGSRWGTEGEFSLQFDLVNIKRGTNAIALLSGSVGLPNYGAYFDKANLGVLGPVKFVSPNGTEMDLSNAHWGYKVGLDGIEVARLYLGMDTKGWRTDLQVNQSLAWYKTSFDTPPGGDPVVLDLEGMGKGIAWVNGHNMGRYWPSYLTDHEGCDPCDYRGAYKPTKCRTNCGGNPSQKWYHVPRSFLNKGRNKNTLVLFEEFGGNPANVSVQTVSPKKLNASAKRAARSLNQTKN